MAKLKITDPSEDKRVKVAVELPARVASAAARVPCTAIVGAPGVPPVGVVTDKPGTVIVWVTPPAVTVRLLPKTRIEVVADAWTPKTAMPPRIPIVAAGVVTAIVDVLLIRPPMRRNTPLVAFTASSPFWVVGS